MKELYYANYALPTLFARHNIQNISIVFSKYLLRLRGLELLDARGLTGLSSSCLIRTLGSRSGDSRRLCRFSLVILSEILSLLPVETKCNSTFHLV